MYTENFDLEGKLAVVTGGGGGIGQAIVRGLADSGVDVVIADIMEEAQNTVKEIKQETRSNCSLIKTDVTNKEEVEGLFDNVENEFGTVDILVNCAGIIHRPRTKALNFEEEAWDKVQNVNSKGVLFCCQAAGKRMIKKNQGKIINIASTSGIRPVKNHIAYCTSKASVIHITKVFALELADSNIQVNAIAPFYIRTPLNEVTFKDKEKREAILSNIPVGRIGEPSDVVGASIFLASPASDWITGHTLVVDGGAMT